jgi:hypothetical protein
MYSLLYLKKKSKMPHEDYTLIQVEIPGPRYSLYIAEWISEPNKRIGAHEEKWGV